MLRRLAFILAIVVGVTSALLVGRQESGGAEKVTLLWQSGIGNTGSQFCVYGGWHSDYYNGTGRALDVHANTTCNTPANWGVNANSIGYAPTNHQTGTAFVKEVQKGSDRCDIVQIATVTQGPVLRGNVYYYHVVKDVAQDYGIAQWVGPGLPRNRAPVNIAHVINDSGCPWGGYHLHQGSPQGEKNTALQHLGVYNVWNIYHFLHKWCYTEGVPGMQPC